MTTRYCLFLAWSNLVFFAAVFLFTGGFLLRRQVLPDRTPCPTSRQSCNSVPGQYEKAIVVVIDALKYDFAVFNDTLKDIKPYQNALPAVQRLSDGGGGRLYEFLADPPSTTMQRLKGLTTGSLPTFIDVSNNFASYEINEDNIIDQLVERGKRVVFAGDDTWLGLFPGRFTRAYPFPSFDVWDLDTVDTGVTRHLYQELTQPDQWDVLIGHYLGVDHAGHKYGPNHVEMRRKLTEMNQVIETVAAKMPDNCVLFVMGDHGMTMTGDHGGDSQDELSAALFVYSRALVNASTKNHRHHAAVNQVDFVPTFSLLLGLPIPFSNLGKVIHEVMVPHAIKQLQYLKVNVEQVFNYLTTYRLSDSGRALPRATFDTIQNMTAEFRDKRSSAMKPTEVIDVLRLGTDLLQDAKAMCQATFIEFNLNRIASGLTLICLHVCLLLVLMWVPKNLFIRSIVNGRFLANLATSAVAGAAVSSLATALYMPDSTDFAPVVTASVGLSLMACGFTLLWRLRYSLKDVVASVRSTNCLDLGHCLLCALLFAGFFSNSFVVEEASVYTFCLAASTVAYAFSVGHSADRKNTWPFALLSMGLARCATMYFRCREEQQGWCVPTDFHKPIGTLSHDISRAYKNWRFFSTILAVFLTVLLPHVWLKACGNLNGMSLPVLIARYMPTTIGLAMVSHWALQGLPTEMASKLLPWQHNFLAQVVFGLCLVSLIGLLIQPHLTFLVGARKHREVPNLYDGVQTYYNFMKSNWKDHFTVRTGRKTVFGLGTALSAPLVVVAILLAFVSMMLLGDGLCPSVCLMGVSTALHLYVTSVCRIRQFDANSSIFDLMHVPWSSVVGWTLLEGFYFYATGHQPTFPSIQWGAAFVGFSGTSYGASSEDMASSYVLPAMLIGWNTFMSRLWFGLLLPFLLVAPFTVWMTVPSVRPTWCQEDHLKSTQSTAKDDLMQGETVLLEHRDEAKAHLFRLCVKYCVLQGLRVFAAMLSAALHRRHLMVWKIFAPRFIFEAVGFLVSLVAIIVGYILYVRIQSSLCKYVWDVCHKDK